MLNDCCKIFRGTKILPEKLANSLKAADDSNEGYLTKRKFASVITANEHMHTLSPIALESVMAFFQKSKSGSQIDYRAFLTFMGAKRPVVSNGSALMAKMVMHNESAMDEFAKYDAEGSGYVKRADFYDTVRGLGFNYLSSSDMDDIAGLFEFGNRKGEIYYSAFVEYVCQQEAALELRDIEGKVRRFIKGSAVGSDQNAFREVFAKFDAEGKGVVSAAEFGKGLDSLGLALARSDMEKLFMRADPRGEGVSYKDFVSFILEGDETDVNEPDKMSSDYDMGLLQLKCFAVANEFSGRHPDLKGLGDPFMHYDWRRTGKLPLRCFASAVRSAGFTLSRAEIVVLAQNFGEGGVVPYNDFLNWCAPDGNAARPVIGGNVSLETLMAKLRSLAARSENGSYSKWANVFEAADVDGSGIIEEDKCRQSFRTLGVRITEAECRALSVEFGAGKKTAVRYRALLRVLFPGSGLDGDGKGINALRRLQSSANRCDMDLSEIARKAREIFAELDLDGIGYCTTRSFKKGLVKLVNKVKLAAPSDNDVEELLERYDTNGDGSVGWKEFISESFAGGGVGAGEEMEAISRFKVMIKRCVRKGIDYRAAFERLDEGFKGSLSSIDFKSALQELGGGLTEGEINALAGKFRVPGTVRGGAESAERTVLYIELLHSLMPAREVEWDEVDGWRIEEKLRSMIKNRFEFWVPGKLNKAFKFFDRPTPNGKINVDQLADGLKRLKAFRLSSSQEQRLFEIMDMGGNGHVTYNDFVVFVRDANFSDVANKIIGDLRKNSIKSGEVKKILEKAASGNALLGIKEFKDCMDALGVTLSKSDCMRLSNWMFVDEENSNISVKQFVDFVKRDGKREDGAGDDGFLSDDASDDDDDESGDDEDKSKKGAKLLKKLKERLQKAENKGIGGKSSFSYFDKNSNGEIDEKELVAGYKQLLKVALTKRESKELMEAFKGKKIGRIKLKEFLKALDLDEDDNDSANDGSDSDDDKKPKAKKSGRSKSREKSKDRNGGDIAAMLRKEINRLGKSSKGKPDIKKVFKAVTHKENGSVSERDFKKALTKMGFDFTPSEMEKLLERLDENGDGDISWKEFERFSRVDYSESSDVDDDESGNESEEEMSPADMKKMIQKAAKKAKRGGSSLNYKRVFGRLDVLDDEFISKKEFKKACEELGFDFDDDEMKAMVKKFDKKNDGKVKYKLFEKLAKQDDDDDDDEKDVDDLALMVRKELKRVTEHTGIDGPKVRKAFDKADSAGDGYLSNREFKKCLKNLGFTFKVEEEDDLIDYIDTDGDGKLSYREFMNLLGVKKGKKKVADSDSEKSDSDDDNDDDAYNQLIEKLCSAIEKGRDVLAAFEFFDKNSSGEISEDQFKEGLEKLRVKGNGKAIKRAFNKFKGRRTGKIVFKDFVKAVEKKSSGGGSSKKGKRGRRIYDDDDTISKKLKKELKRLTKSNRGPPLMRTVFEEMDENGNGTIDESELKKGMQQMGFELDRKEIKEVMSKFDENGRGEIKFEDFVYFLQGEDGRDDDSDGGGGSDEEVDECIEALRKEFKRITKSRNGPPRIRAVFEEIDDNGDGVVSKREFRKALDEMGFRFSESQIKKIMKKIDFDNDGGCSHEEFEALCEGKNKKGKKSKVDLSEVDSSIVRKLKKSEVVTDGELMDEFEKLEREYTGNKRGNMKVKDFEKAVKSSFDGVRLSRSDIKEIVEACDPNETGKVQYEKFVNALEK
jgi:Ca2+-binding EF-hand superfamily protein